MSENVEANVNVNQGGGSEQVDMTVAEGQAAKPDEGPSPDSLGVSQAQFDKYYDAEKGYNWEAHAKEQQFQSEQKNEGKSEEKKWTGEINDDTVPEIIDMAGLDLEELATKVATTGDIDDADYEALKAIGINESVANQYAEQLFSESQNHITTVMNILGGDKAEENIAKLVEMKVLDPNDADSIGRALADPKTGGQFAQGLMAQLGSKDPQPVRLRGDQGGGSAETNQGYSTQAAMIADMRDPRYKSDPSFRAGVMAKVKAATFSDPTKRHTGGL